MSRIETEIAPKSAETVRLGGHSFDPVTETLLDAEGYPVRLRAQSTVLAVLCRALSWLPDLAVISTSSSFAYRDSPLPIDRIAAELGADYVLRGSVRRSGDRVRVNASLVDGSGVNVWAGRVDGEVSDIFQVQDVNASGVTQARSGVPDIDLAEWTA